MRIRTLLSNLTAFAFAAFIVDAASAVDKTWSPGGSPPNGNYNVAGNWTPTGVPTSSDRCIFPSASGSAYVVTIDSAGLQAGQLDVHADCTINISAGNRLELGGSNGQTSYMDGPIVLASSTSVLRVMFDHIIRPKTVDMDREVIVGQNAAADLDDDPGNGRALTLGMNGTGRAILQGTLQIAVDTLRNNGLIYADNGVMEFVSGTLLGAGAWVVASGDELQFDSGVAATALLGQFVIAGTLDVDENVSTEGDLTFTAGGVIEVASGKSFSAGQ